MVQATAVALVSVMALVWKRITRRAQLAIKPLYAISRSSGMGELGEYLHYAMQKGEGKSNLLPERNIQSPDKWERHYEHNDTSDHVWDCHVALKGYLVDTLAPTDRLVPLVGNRRALEDCCEGIDETSRNDDSSNDIDGNSEAPFAGCKDTSVEEQDGAFTHGYGDTVDGHPCDRALDVD